MTSLLLTGGTGGLGRLLLPRLQSAGYEVRMLVRRPPAEAAPGVTYAVGDLATGAGLAEAVGNVDAILHAASSPMKQTWTVDVDGTRRLLEAARSAQVGHFLYVSIVGVDRHPYPYYRAKWAAEQAVEQSGVPYTIQRATQFHSLVHMILRSQANWPLLLLPTDFQVQSVDEAEAAAHLAASLGRGAAGRPPDLAGPEVLTLGDMARAWLAARGKRRPIVRLPLPGKIGAAFRAGVNTAPQQRVGRLTWGEYLQRHVSSGREA